MAVIRILIAEGQPFVRKKICQLIESQTDMLVVAEANSRADIMQKLKACRPQVLLLDTAMSRQPQTLEVICSAAPTTKVIVLSIYGDQSYRYEVFKAGAVGFQIKTGPAQELLMAIRMAVQGKRYQYCPWPSATQRSV